MTSRFEFVEIITLTVICVYLFHVIAYIPLDKEISTAYNNSITTTINILNDQRGKIVVEMQSLECEKGFENFTILTPETNGNPFRNIIVTTWRSGSTFLGAILNSMPGNYHHFEPLVNYGITVVRGPPYDEQAIYQLKQLLHCNYSNLNEYVNFGAKHKFVYSYNTRLWNYCYLHPGHPNKTRMIQRQPDDPRFCSNANFLSSFCRLFPLQSMKILRLRLALAEQLLEDPTLNVRIVFLVRDPRAMMSSRKQCSWCSGNPDCEHTATVCGDLVFDYYTAKKFQTKYPHRFKVVRYEELSLQPFKLTEEILKFYGLPFDQMVVKYLESHTKQNIGNIYSTFRDSSSTPFRWMYNLTYKEIDEIQSNCSNAMELWGYKKMEEEDVNCVEEFNPLLELMLNETDVKYDVYQ